MTAITAITSEEVAGFDIERATDDLAMMADWAAELRARIARIMLVYELHDVDVDFTELAAEVTAFKRVIACIRWRQE